MGSKRQDAPGELEHVRGFVNTVDIEDGQEQLASASALANWLSSRGLLEEGAGADDEELGRALDVREALRALLLANNGGPQAPAAAARLEEAAERAGLALRFDGGEASLLAPQAPGVDGALGRLAAIVHHAMRDGTWRRLKACPWHTCHWAFYDHTKNHSGVWCTMEVCGNRAKARAYRERHAASPSV
jgi:predicted RNA-binding Zn ribbon-like protein